MDLLFVTRVFWRSLAMLRDPSVWMLLLVPVAVAIGVFVLLLIVALQPLASQFLLLPPVTWFEGMGWMSVASVFAWVAAWLMLFAISYAVAALFSGLVIVSRLSHRLGRTAYPNLRPYGSDRTVQSLWVSISTTLVYLAGWLLTLPLWLIPGLAFILPIGWLAWFNARTLGFDALTYYANDSEFIEIRQRFRGSFLMLGTIGALIAHIPLIGFFAASLTALMFAVAALEALNQIRGQSDGVVEGEIIMNSTWNHLQ